MTNPDQPTGGWTVIGEVPGQLQAEIVRGLLEAQEISVHLTQEGAGRALGLAFAPLGTVQILVPKRDRMAAEAIYNSYENGDFEDTIFFDESGDLEP